MANQILHPRYVDALLNGESITDVKDAIEANFDSWRRRIDRQHATAVLMQKVLQGPEDDPERAATIAFLQALKGGDNND